MDIGQILYYTSPSGGLARTAVSSIAIDGDFGVLDSQLSYGQRFSEPENAIDRARAILEERLKCEADTFSPKDRCALEERLQYLNGDTVLAELISRPLVWRNAFGIFDWKDKKYESIPDDTFPNGYFVPGQKVFALITPRTHYMFTTEWRPRPYFILQCIVRETLFSPNWQGNLYYYLKDTQYSGFPRDRLRATMREARQRMTEIFADETCGVIDERMIPVFSASEEKKIFDKAKNNLIESRKAKA